MPAFIVTNHSSMSEGNFTIQTNNEIGGMTENPNFPDPPHLIKDVETKFTTYKALSKDRYQRSPKETDDRNTLRRELNTMLRENGMYIIAKYPDDRDKQLSSGYMPVAVPNRSGQPNDPTNVKASSGSNDGEVKLYWKGSSIARGYTLRYRIKGSDEPWQYKSVSKTRGVVVGGLVSGELYEFWVLALGAKKDSNYGGPGEARAK